MKKLMWVGALAAFAAGCEPQFETKTPPVVAVARFDPSQVPPVVPTPNDLATNPATGKLNITPAPDATEADREFTEYLNTLDGFPTSATATAHFDAKLEPAGLSESSVRVLDIDDGHSVVQGVQRAYEDLDTGPAASKVTVRPPPTGWTKGKRYAVAIIAGEQGLKGAGGELLVGSSTWKLVRSASSLVTCEDLSSPDCRATTEIIPTEKTDPEERIADQAAKAVSLERLRRKYAPTIEALVASGVARDDIALLWTFKAVSLSEAVFDPASSVVPFPNNILLDPTTERVKLPVPAGASPLQQALIAGLNTLDGFSTTAPIVSENSDPRGATDVAEIDAATLPGGTGFVKLTPGGTPPQVVACLDCASSLLPDGGTPSTPQQLQFVPQVPLDERSTFAAYLTSALTDTRGKELMASSTFALARSKAPLVDANGKSQVPSVSDAQAAALEPLRLGLKPVMDALEAAGKPRREVVLAWAFSTQSAASTLQQLHALPQQVALPTAPDWVAEVTTQVLSTSPFPTDNIGAVYAGTFTTLYALNGPLGTLAPPPPVVTRRVPFLLTLPSSPAPAGGYPITIWGHGLQSNHRTMLGLASALATAGRALIAFDVVFHGERTTCAGAASVIPGVTSDDAACSDPTTQRCDAASGRCVARTGPRTPCNPTGVTPGDLLCSSLGEGACVPDGAGFSCEGGDFLRNAQGAPVVGGWNFINTTNLFGTRDNFRQQVIDLAQLTRVLGDTSGAGLAAQAGTALDLSKLDYVGQSLGGLLGTLFLSASPTVRQAVLNVAGGDPAGVLLEAPAFQAARAGFFATLASQGINQGSPAFDNFIGIARWILDPADPRNAVYEASNAPVVPAGRKVFVQYIETDLVIPNSATERLLSAANRVPSAKQTPSFKFTTPASDLALPSRHSFLINFANPAVTATAQAQVVNFLATGVTP